MNLDKDPNGVSLFMPSAFFVDEVKERYYVVNAGRSLLISYDRAGNVLSAFNPGEQLLTPFDMSRDTAGIIWVVEKGRNSLTRIDLAAKKVNHNILAEQGRRIFPDRFEIDAGSFYLLDKSSGSIFVYSADLKLTRRIACDNCGAGFVDFKIQGKSIWALEKSEKSVYRFSLAGSLEEKIELAGQLDFPVSLAIDSLGLIYVLDRHQGQVSVFDTAGRLKYSFLSSGHNREQLYFPVEIKFDPWGQLCIVDEGNGRIMVFSR